MSGFSTPAILLRRIDHGDFDLIATFLTLEKGKISAVAKNAKKSRKRFSGLLELFSCLEIVCSKGRRGGLAVLREASMNLPFAGIRADVYKTLYAGYWAELINGWMEEWKPQPGIYHLLHGSLNDLDTGSVSPAVASIVFQIRFLILAGYAPKIDSCTVCGAGLDEIPSGSVIFDLEKGGIVCNGCAAGGDRRKPIRISKGAVRQLCWMRQADAARLSRLRFTETAVREASEAMERFVPYHLGRMPRSLRVIWQLRRRGSDG
ncbi:MAG: DNA repair protein RecO [Desulfosalsimonas sp.]